MSQAIPRNNYDETFQNFGREPGKFGIRRPRLLDGEPLLVTPVKNFLLGATAAIAGSTLLIIVGMRRRVMES